MALIIEPMALATGIFEAALALENPDARFGLEQLLAASHPTKPRPLVA